jgi:thiamine biosynthesis protein ThiI
MKYLAKYSPEITTKSRSVRTRFCRQLRKNLARMLREQLGLVDTATAGRNPAAIEVEANWDNLQLRIPAEHAALLPRIEDILANTPVIWKFNRVLVQRLGSLDAVLELVHQTWAGRLAGKTFVVRCKRMGKHGFSSMEVERFVGAGLLSGTAAKGVSLHAPEVVVNLEIRGDAVFVVDVALDGIGGFPLGTQDAVVSLLSGGFDSAVATFMSMRRGMRAHCLFFNLGGQEHELAVKELAYYLWNKFGSSHQVYFISVPFEGVLREILENVDNSSMGVTLKRMMLRAGARIATELNAAALVTGESVAQVSSQTLTNLAVIDEVCPMLVLRPLIMSDKQEIVDMARRIGTAQFSAVIPEYCGVISVRPATRARRQRVERNERSFDMSVLERALADRVLLEIGTLQQVGSEVRQEPDCVTVPEPGSMIIDIRHPDEQERSPLLLAGIEVLNIPFYRLATDADRLPRERRCYLYCGKGVMSRLHAAHLRQKGWTSIGVYLSAK